MEIYSPGNSRCLPRHVLMCCGFAFECPTLYCLNGSRNTKLRVQQKLLNWLVFIRCLFNCGATQYCYAYRNHTHTIFHPCLLGRMKQFIWSSAYFQKLPFDHYEPCVCTWLLVAATQLCLIICQLVITLCRHETSWHVEVLLLWILVLRVSFHLSSFKGFCGQKQGYLVNW